MDKRWFTSFGDCCCRQLSIDWYQGTRACVLVTLLMQFDSFSSQLILTNWIMLTKLWTLKKIGAPDDPHRNVASCERRNCDWSGSLIMWYRVGDSLCYFHTLCYCQDAECRNNMWHAWLSSYKMMAITPQSDLWLVDAWNLNIHEWTRSLYGLLFENDLWL